MKTEHPTQYPTDEDKYYSAIESSGFGFWLIDSTGTLLDANNSYAKLSGYSRSELIGMHFSSLVVLEDDLTAAQHLEIICSDNRVRQAQHRRKDGTLWDVEYSTSQNYNLSLIHI